MNYTDIIQDEDQWKLELIMEALNAGNPSGKWVVRDGWLGFESVHPRTPSRTSNMRQLANGAWLMLERMTSIATGSRLRLQELAMEQRGATRPLRHLSDRELDDLVLEQVTCAACHKVLPSFRNEEGEDGSELSDILAAGVNDPGDCDCPVSSDSEPVLPLSGEF